MKKNKKLQKELKESIFEFKYAIIYFQKNINKNEEPLKFVEKFLIEKNKDKRLKIIKENKINFNCSVYETYFNNEIKELDVKLIKHGID